MILQIYKLFRFFFLTLFILFSIYAVNLYEGSKLIFIIYCLSFVTMFFYLTDKKSTYFEIFFSFYLFMGFWLKYIYSLIWRNGKVIASGQEFSNNIDQVLIIGILIAAICLFSSFINKKIIKKNFVIYNKNTKQSFFEYLYLNYKFLVLLIFVLTFCTICFFNVQLNIHQRGFINLIKFDPIITNLIKWLLMFGFTTFSCFLINTEILYKEKINFSTALVALIEIFTSSTSMLSRIFTVKASFFFLVISREILRLKKNVKKFIFAYAVLVLFLSSFSLYIVNEIRISKTKFFIDTVNLKKLSLIENKVEIKKLMEDIDSNWVDPNTHANSNEWKKPIWEKRKKVKEIGLIIDEKHNSSHIIYHMIFQRWIGLDSLIAVFNYEHKSFNFFIEAFGEKKTNKSNTFYEKIFDLKRSIVNVDNSQIMKGNTLPGIISFLYYSGNLYFVLFMLFLLILFFSSFENFLKKITKNNLIFSSFISSLIVGRLINFGYAPKDSYLFIISILLSILIMIFLQRAFYIQTGKK